MPTNNAVFSLALIASLDALLSRFLIFFSIEFRGTEIMTMLQRLGVKLKALEKGYWRALTAKLASSGRTLSGSKKYTAGPTL